MHKNRLLSLLLIVILVIGVVGLHHKVRAVGEDYPEMGQLLEVLALVKTQYVDDVSILELMAAYAREGTLNGMLKRVLEGEPYEDRYTTYLTPRIFKEMQMQSQGDYGGLGVTIGLDQENRLIVVAPFEDTPAFRAGLKPGDHIMRINGKSTRGMSTDEAANIMRGNPGTDVDLVILRGEDEEIDLTITREIISLPTIRHEIIEDGVGFVRIAGFSNRTAKELEEALLALEAQGIRGLIMDLRYNPGGILQAAVEMTGIFMPYGPALYVAGRDARMEPIMSSWEGSIREYPVVILVNEGSASAAEILSGALQDRGRAILVGSQTFGKGLVQTVYPLRDGSALSLTTQRYLTAGQKAIHGVGITPDIVVELSQEAQESYVALDPERRGEDDQFQAALQALHQAIR